MQPADFAALAIVGAAVSALVQVIKVNTFVSPKAAVITLSIVAGTAYYLLRDTAVWEASLSILAVANTVYLFLVKPMFEQ